MSVWVEINFQPQSVFVYNVTLHVSVWVEILSVIFWNHTWNGHAPRERVSWNWLATGSKRMCDVTLHVSVWVEMGPATLDQQKAYVTLHVSVWVEIRVKTYSIY